MPNWPFFLRTTLMFTTLFSLFTSASLVYRLCALGGPSYSRKPDSHRFRRPETHGTVQNLTKTFRIVVEVFPTRLCRRESSYLLQCAPKPTSLRLGAGGLRPGRMYKYLF